MMTQPPDRRQPPGAPRGTFSRSAGPMGVMRVRVGGSWPPGRGLENCDGCWC